MSKEIVYSGDPLCAWCFGFTDIFTHIQETFRDSVGFSMIMGGLRVDSSFMIDESTKIRMHQNLVTVSKRTGQAFSVDRLHELPDGKYNSEPPCRAVITVRTLDPGCEFAYYKALHRAFYLDMKNIMTTGCLCGEAEKLGIDSKEFMTAFESREIREKTRQDFELSQRLGVLGYPALVLKDETGQQVLNQGYKPLDQLTRAIESWLDGKNAPIIF